MKNLSTLSKSMIILFALLFFTSAMYAGSRRVAVSEEFTGVNCGYCAAYNPALQTYWDAHFGDILPMAFSCQTGPMTSTDAYARTSLYGVSGIPALFLNGSTQVGANNVAAMDAIVQQCKTETSPVTINVVQTLNGATANVQVSIQTEQSLSGYMLQVFAVEKYHKYTPAPGSNKETEFKYICRKMLPNSSGTALSLAAGSQQTYNFSYTIPAEWTADQMYTTAIVQKTATKEIIQGAYSGAGTSTQIEVTTADKGGIIQGGTKTTKNFTVTNPNPDPISVKCQIDTDNSTIPAGWTVTATPTQQPLAAGASLTGVLNVTPSSAASYAKITVKVTPVAEGTTAPSYLTYYFITDAAKYAMWTGTTKSSWGFDAFKQLGTKATQTVEMPLDEMHLSLFPPSSFNISIFAADYWSAGALSAENYSDAVIDAINASITAGKNVLITGEMEVFTAQEFGTSKTKDFYGNKLGIQTSTDPLGRVKVNSNNQIVEIVQFPLNGFSGDPIGKGIAYTVNNYSSIPSDPYVVFTDILVKRSGSKAVPFLYYDNDATKVGGMRLEVGNAKVVYLSFGLAAIGNSAQRSELMQKIVDWFEGTAVAGPEATLSVSELSYGKVPTDETKDMPFQINNIGGSTMNVSDVLVDYSYSNVFITRDVPHTPFTIEPNQSQEITVRFAPKAEIAYNANLTVSSDASNGDVILALKGTGDVPTVGVNDEEVVLLSVKTAPNPFTDRTTIKYTIGGMASSSVQLYVVDASGREVARLVNSVLAPGEYSAELNSAALSSGTYFVIAKVNNKTIQTPVVLIK